MDASTYKVMFHTHPPRDKNDAFDRLELPSVADLMGLSIRIGLKNPYVD